MEPISGLLGVVGILSALGGVGTVVMGVLAHPDNNLRIGPADIQTAGAQRKQQKGVLIAAACLLGLSIGSLGTAVKYDQPARNSPTVAQASSVPAPR
jgi:hypothetical protein